MQRNEIMELIQKERERQDRIHPGRIDSELYLFAVLTEEVGEVAKALQEGSNVVEELLQVAAVCVKWLETRP